MKLYRIYAMLLKFFYVAKHNLEYLLETFYWPFIDLVLWGITTRYFLSLSNASPNILTMVLSGIMLWLIVYRSSSDLTMSLLEEIWSRNLLNIFGSPLLFVEWMISVLVIAFLRAITSIFFAGIFAIFLYQTNLFTYSFSFLPLILPLLFTGWAIGNFLAGLIYRFGTRIQSLAWSAVMIISPFSAIYYPATSLPLWAQKISQFIPTSYIFESARSIVSTGSVDNSMIIRAIALSIIYFVFGTLFLVRSFKTVLNKGLASVY